jgi:putative hemolysin
MLMDIPILFLLIVLNGLFAMAELALIGARRTRLQTSAAAGDAGAKSALALLDNSARFLSTVSIAISLIGIVVATVGGDSFVQPLSEIIQTIPVLKPYAHALALISVVAVNGVFAMVIGELVPKRIAVAHPEAIARRLSGFMTVVSRIVAPAEWLLSGVTTLILKLLPISHAGPAPVTDEEISLIMKEGAASGAFHEAETAIVQMALRLGDRRVEALMTQRTQLEMLDLQDDWPVNREKIATSGFSRFPVVEGGPDNVLGVLQIRDLALAALSAEDADNNLPASSAEARMSDIRALIQPPLFVPNTMPALKLLELLKQSGAALALVVDEYGDLDGLITQHDILLALVGDIAGEDPAEARSILPQDDGSWLIAGLTAIDDVKDAIGIHHLPDEDSGNFHTLGGFVMAQMRRVPKTGDTLDINGWHFEVVAMDGHRVDRVKIVRPWDNAAERPAKS